MPSSSEAVPAPLSGAIARTRSRYKGPRPDRSFASTQEPPNLSADQFQRLKDAAPTHRVKEPNGNVAPPKSVAEPKSNPRSGPANHELSDVDVKPPPRICQGSRTIDLGSRENTRENPRPEEAVQINRPDRESQSLSGQELDERRARLHSGRRDEQLAVSRPRALTKKKSLTQRVAGQTDGKRRSKSREQLKRTISGPIAIESPQNIIAPAFDAPISAVNAGERRVTVKYGEFTMSLPVTPSTTPMDIIHLADDRTRDQIRPKDSILEESYRQLGLERPLRKYEHIRNVMNSWDNDMQNQLIISQSPTGENHEDLELNCVSRTQPGDTSVSIYHSQRPGHWDKRWVTLRSDGQISIAKKDGGETSNICHLSDFDIYVPTARQLSKKIRPPRKMCFAVKSQQKSIMFMTTVNFVHFFSTGDEALAASWYRAVQEWRSWYLVNVMGEGLNKAKSPANVISSVGHKPSMDSHFGKSSVRSGDHRIETAESASRGLTIRNQVAPPISYPRKLTKDAEAGAPSTRREGPSTIPTLRNIQQPEPFAATGLLGRTYTQRQKAQQRLESSQTQGSSPPPAVSTALSSSDGLKRTSSQQPRARPLIDLTPQYREPPQHARKGRGIVPEQIPAGGLVEIATSPEEAISVPPTTTWQRPGTSSGQDGPTLQGPRTVRRDHSAASTGSQQKSQSPEKGELPFTGGLLAGNSRGQGGIGLGRGVITGDREAKAPMLDVTEESDYARGSLLDRAEKRDGGLRPVVEREKRREVNTAMGKGI